jgi:phage gp36-like protein
MAAPYATLPDLYAFLPLAQMGNVTTDQQQAALDFAADIADSYLARRYALPLIAPYPLDLVRAVCQIAALEALTTRGFSAPTASKPDQRRIDQDAAARKWLDDVGHQKLHPRIIEQPSQGATYDAPQVHTSRLRGW